MLIDLHVHSSISECSCLSLDQILSHARAKGLDGVCITDHDTMAAGRLVAEGVQSNGLCLIIGQEYTTTQGDFLLFGPYEDLLPGLAAPDLLRLVQATGGAAIAAHPFRTHRPVDEALVRTGLCSIIERINGRNQDLENARTQVWLERYSLTSVRGSDAHSLDELGRLPVHFDGPIRSRSDLVQALNLALCTCLSEPGVTTCSEAIHCA